MPSTQPPLQPIGGGVGGAGGDGGGIDGDWQLDPVISKASMQMEAPGTSVLTHTFSMLIPS